MNPEAMESLTEALKAQVEVEVVRKEESQQAKPAEPEKSYWEVNGFVKEIARICSDLEGEREQFLFNARTRQLIDTVLNAKTVEDFDRYSRDQINEFIQILRNDVPRVEREVVSFINQLTRARAVQVDTVDYI